MTERKNSNNKENDKEPKIRRKSRKSFISLFNIASNTDTAQSVKRRTCRFCCTTTKLTSPYNFQHHIRSFCPKLKFFFSDNGFGQQFCCFCSSSFHTIEEGHMHILKMHEDEAILCNSCANVVAIKDCKQHMIDHLENARSKSQKCSKCFANFDNSYQFLTHMMNRHNYTTKTLTTAVIKRHLICHCPFSLLAVTFEKEQY